ncbi:hypothetical protein ACQY0O_001807 [Thecaphora frezii]
MVAMLDPLQVLPEETFLYLLTFSDPFTLSQASLVSRSWNRLIDDDQLWRQLFVLLGFAGPRPPPKLVSVAGTLQEVQASDVDVDADFDAALRQYTSRSLTTFFDDCKCYRHLCCRLWKLERRWSGSNIRPSKRDNGSKRPVLRPRVTARGNTSTPAYWRFKLDPVERTIINTGIAGGVVSADAVGDQRILWQLETEMTDDHPHLEFSNGWMTYCRPNHGFSQFEIWKSDRIRCEEEGYGATPQRGYYWHHALLNAPNATCAYRLQYPVLAAASLLGRVVLYHVSSREVLQTIDLAGSQHGEGNINYIDFDDEYVFLIGDGAKVVSAFSRATGRLVWNLGDHFAAGRGGPTTWKAVIGDPPSSDGREYARVDWRAAAAGEWQASSNRMNRAQLYMKPYQCWAAIHVDVKTRTLLVLGQGSLLVLRDYKEFLRDPSRPLEAFEELVFRDVLYGVFDSETVELLDHRDSAVWNDRHVWDNSPAALMAVHNGRAFCVNVGALFIDLEHPGPVARDDASYDGEDRDTAEGGSAAQEGERKPPCCSLYMNYDGFADPSACEDLVSLQLSSCAQMDDTAAYCTQTLAGGEVQLVKFDFTQTHRDGAGVEEAEVAL